MSEIMEINELSIIKFFEETEEKFDFSIVPTDPYEQLIRGRAYSKTVKHGKGAFLDHSGGLCVRGILVAGSGIVLKPGCNFGYPFTGFGKDKDGNEVDLSIFRKADDALAAVLKGNGRDVMSTNDGASWFDSTYVTAMFEIAIEDYDLSI